MAKPKEQAGGWRQHPGRVCTRLQRRRCVGPCATSALLVLAAVAALALEMPAFAAMRAGMAASKEQKAKAKRKVSMDEKKKAAAAREEEFLSSWRKGLGTGVDPLELADAMVGLKPLPRNEQRRLLSGDWRLSDSDSGDLLVQFGSGLHGLPFIEMKHYFLSLRGPSKQIRAVEVLSMGPAPRVTTVLKGTMQVGEQNLDLEFTGMVDKDGRDTKQAQQGESRVLSTQPLFVGQKLLVLKIDPSDQRKGGFAIFERQANLAPALKDATGETIATLQGGR